MTQKDTPRGWGPRDLHRDRVQDDVALAEAEKGHQHGDGHDLAVRLNDLLLPIVKGSGSGEVLRAAGLAVAADLRRLRLPAGLPVDSTSGTPRSTPCTRATTAIQGMDFFFRKIMRTRARR